MQSPVRRAEQLHSVLLRAAGGRLGPPWRGGVDVAHGARVAAGNQNLAGAGQRRRVYISVANVRIKLFCCLHFLWCLAPYNEASLCGRGQACTEQGISWQQPCPAALLIPGQRLGCNCLIHHKRDMSNVAGEQSRQAISQ
jgi:hypothetical protein